MFSFLSSHGHFRCSLFSCLFAGMNHFVEIQSEGSRFIVLSCPFGALTVRHLREGLSFLLPLAPLQPWLIPGVHVFGCTCGRQREKEDRWCACACACACRCKSRQAFVLAFVLGSLHDCLCVSRQTPSGQSQIKSPHLFVAFEEDCVCHLPGAHAMLT